MLKNNLFSDKIKEIIDLKNMSEENMPSRAIAKPKRLIQKWWFWAIMALGLILAVVYIAHNFFYCHFDLADGSFIHCHSAVEIHHIH